MKKEMNYDAIYQETASRLLLLSRTCSSDTETSLRRLVHRLRDDICCRLVELGYIQRASREFLTLRVLPDGETGLIDIDLHIPYCLANNIDCLQESLNIHYRKDIKKVIAECHALANDYSWFPQYQDDDPIFDAIANYRRMEESYDELARKYATLENSHLIQYGAYAKNRIEKEGAARDATSYVFLCVLDTFCSPDDEGFFSGQTMVLVRSDWNYATLPENIRFHIKSMLEKGGEEHIKFIRENLNHSAFLSCKVGGYYPLTFEQLWDQMAVGMKITHK